MLRSLVGSEMCIRDRYRVDIAEEEAGKHGAGLKKVDYTMEVDLHQSDCYHRHHPDVGQLLHTSTSSPSTIIPVHSNKITSQSMAPPVPELYHPRQPADNIQPITISTTGSYHVGVVPSCIAVDDEVGARCVVIEGQMDGIPIVRGITSVEDKYVIVRDTTTNSPTSTDDSTSCLLYTSDAADEEDSVDLGGRRIIKKKKNTKRT
eukprot:TRINITY_DN22828_c0_g1_i1.p1 TRINITY_DN22828_c0_g1~~TRINITY_DN22828_c0_g1_i1.p1  ORF type:complete len:205 (+),score=70.57 TRINITY_DN22828_c0_g1_i1:123-737(+)